MPRLSAPTVDVHDSFLAAMAEFQAEGRGGDEDSTMVGTDIREFGASWKTAEGFGEYVRWLRGQALADTPRPTGYVSSTTLWWVHDEDYLGRIAIRHRLTPRLLEIGGHIGFDVRPSQRRQGHARQMLTDTLPVAASLGIDPVLITCDVDNEASRKVIEGNGGVLEDQRIGKLRYWVPTR
jgi:predicted acetyltransferase